MIELTTPNGEKICVAVEDIKVLTENHGNYHAAAKTVVTLGIGKQAVRESIDEIMQLLPKE